MIGTVVGLIEFVGLVIAAWIVGEFLVRGVTAHHADSPWAQGLAAVTGG